MFILMKCSFLISLQQVFIDGMGMIHLILKHTISSSSPGRVCTQVMVMGQHLAEVAKAISMLYWKRAHLPYMPLV